MVQDIVLGIMWIARIIIAVRLLQVAARTAHNLRWLAGTFLSNAIYYTFMFSFFSSELAVRAVPVTLGLMVAHICVIMFIHRTFYQGQKSPFKIFIVATVVAGLLDLILNLGFGKVTLFIYLAATVNWVWHGNIAYQAYRQVVQDKYIEDWIKVRYQLMIAYCATLSLTLLGFFVPIFPNASAMLQNIGNLSALVGIILQFLVWVMPEGFRLWLNRNYHEKPEEEIVLD